jgi:transcriptional regulator with XRE-family HTH domain
LSIREAERRSGLDGTYWRKLEDGQYESPSPKSLLAIAETLGLPIEDLYALVGYAVPKRLPAFTPYLRAKFDLPPEAVADLERFFGFLRAYYDIPADKPVFPPKPKEAPKPDDQARPDEQTSKPGRPS